MTTSKTQRDENSAQTLVQTVGGMGMNVTLGIQLALSWVIFIGGGVRKRPFLIRPISPGEGAGTELNKIRSNNRTKLLRGPGEMGYKIN